MCFSFTEGTIHSPLENKADELVEIVAHINKRNKRLLVHTVTLVMNVIRRPLMLIMCKFWTKSF